MIKRIKYALNNETGGPNIETLIGIGVALTMGIAAFALGSAQISYANKGSSNMNRLTSNMPNS